LYRRGLNASGSEWSAGGAPEPRAGLRRSGGQVPSSAPRRRGLRIVRDGVFLCPPKNRRPTDSLRGAAFSSFILFLFLYVRPADGTKPAARTRPRFWPGHLYKIRRSKLTPARLMFALFGQVAETHVPVEPVASRGAV